MDRGVGGISYESPIQLGRRCSLQLPSIKVKNKFRSFRYIDVESVFSYCMEG